MEFAMSRLDSSDSKSRAKATLEALEPRQLLANVTAGFTDSVFASGLTRPTAMTFAPDGRIYVSVGDNVRGTVAQHTDNLLGKILRINPDGSIPTDNPFYNTATGVNRLIYDLGLRNPFTFAIEKGTNRLFINDVGDAKFEEVDRDSGHGG